MSRLELLNLELEKAEAELENVNVTCSEVVCSMYNVDYKSEIITLLNEEIVCLKSKIIDEIDKND